MVRMNITMPERVVRKLSKVKNKSRFIAEAVEEKIEVQEKKQLLDRLAGEYQEMARDDRQAMKDWDALAAQGWE